MSRVSPAAAVRASATGSKTFGVVLMVIGVLAMMAPMVVGAAAVMAIGFLLIGAGVAMTYGAFRSEAGSFAILLGVVTALAGVTLVVRPVFALASIALLLVVWFLVQGVVEITAALQARPAQGWGILLCGGILSLLLAYLIWSDWPLSGTWAVGILVGVRLVFSGITVLMIGGAQSALARALER
jgi:uncharacterized membrane protein HdeD (DUF308 family)